MSTTSKTSIPDGIRKSYEFRRHNGQCAYGPWLSLQDLDSADVREAIVDEVMECHCRDMWQEASSGNTADRGRVTVGGQVYLYRS